MERASFVKRLKAAARKFAIPVALGIGMAFPLQSSGTTIPEDSSSVSLQTSAQQGDSARIAQIVQKDFLSREDIRQLQISLRNAGQTYVEVRGKTRELTADSDFGSITAAGLAAYCEKNPRILVSLGTFAIEKLRANGQKETLSEIFRKSPEAQTRLYDLLDRSNQDQNSLTQVQSLLQIADLYTRKIDGRDGPGTQGAIQSFRASYPKTTSAPVPATKPAIALNETKRVPVAHSSGFENRTHFGSRDTQGPEKAEPSVASPAILLTDSKGLDYAKLQSALNNAGFDAGPPNGKKSPKTATAMMGYLKRNPNLLPVVSLETLNTLVRYGQSADLRRLIVQTPVFVEDLRNRLIQTHNASIQELEELKVRLSVSGYHSGFAPVQRESGLSKPFRESVKKFAQDFQKREKVSPGGSDDQSIAAALSDYFLRNPHRGRADLIPEILKASQKTGAPFMALLVKAKLESTWGTDTGSPGSSRAAGVFQYTPGTWKIAMRSYGSAIPGAKSRGWGLSLRNDFAISSQITGFDLQDRREKLERIKSVFGGPDADPRIQLIAAAYACHFLGDGGCNTITKASAEQIAKPLFPPSFSRGVNRRLFHNEDKTPKTVGEFRDSLYKKVERVVHWIENVTHEHEESTRPLIQARASEHPSGPA